MVQDNTILIVEDDDIDAMMLERGIKKLRPEVAVFRAVNGRDAIDMLDELNPRIIIMDIRMPQMDGREALARLKRDERFQKIPIVMMTTSSNPDDVNFCYQHHANAYLSKGVDSQTIQRDIDSLLTFWFDSVLIAQAGG